MRWSAVLTLGCLSVMWAGDRPDLSGAWKTNSVKSEFGPMPANSLIWDIEHKDPKLKYWIDYQSDQGARSVAMNYSTDGKETVNKTGAAVVKSRCHWEGETLVIESKATTPQGALSVYEKWSLSGDGKMLTMERTMTTPQGNTNQKLVYDKEERRSINAVVEVTGETTKDKGEKR